MSANLTDHWDRAYAEGDTGRSWYQAHAETSLALIRAAEPDLDAAIVDVGGGASTLVDGLLEVGYHDLTVVDISEAALGIARDRLGAKRAEQVRWEVGDVTSWRPDRTYDVWHDRAVLHFMTASEQREAYHHALLAGTGVGAAVVIGVFGPAGPEKCSGLTVTRYSVEDLAAFLGDGFEVVSTAVADHTTPAGASQQFVWMSARRLR